MRVFLCLLFVLPLFGSPAWADQTDPSLEPLFLELRDGSVLDADATTARIVELWSQAPSPTVTLLYERAEEALRLGNLDLAEIMLSHVTGLAPSFAQGWALAGRVERMQGNAQRALQDFEKALSLEPRHFLVRMELVDILLASGEDKAAYEMIQKVLEWNPHLEEARNIAARLRRKLGGDAI